MSTSGLFLYLTSYACLKELRREVFKKDCLNLRAHEEANADSNFILSFHRG